jgi:TetR/AcrR family transcriptional regulator, transcriptional repressor for nem operon
MPRPKAFNHDDALESAMLVFWEKGYEATSMQDLVDRMNINRQSLYDTFGDKNALYLSALERYRATEGRRAFEPLRELGSIRERLERVFENLIDEATNDPCRRGCFVANATLEMASRDPKIACLVQDGFLSLVQTFEDVLSGAQSRGELKPDKNPRALALFLANTVQGLRVTGKLTLERRTLEDIARTALEALD